MATLTVRGAILTANSQSPCLKSKMLSPVRAEMRILTGAHGDRAVTRYTGTFWRCVICCMSDCMRGFSPPFCRPRLERPSFKAQMPFLKRIQVSGRGWSAWQREWTRLGCACHKSILGGSYCRGSLILLRAPVSLRLVVTRGLEGRWMVLRAAEGAQSHWKSAATIRM